MKNTGTIVAVYSETRRTGASMIARSLAELLMRETKETVLCFGGGSGCVLSPEEESRMKLEEAGILYLEKYARGDGYEAMRERFPYSVIDGGRNDPNETVNGADLVICVADQYETSLRAAHERIGERMEYAGLDARKWLLCVNRAIPGDPHGAGYLKELFPDTEVLFVPESARGREADWERLTILELGDRSFRKAMKEGVRWILKNSTN